ncbi:hypothetical protein [Dethiothermospora halolimnae]|uniref:hypothetical protein n=1 Tax=Dethiothermospora halolimnae TaxID=3114390 RepID=UPI003CCBA135
MPKKKDKNWLKIFISLFFVIAGIIIALYMIFSDLKLSEVDITEEGVTLLILALIPSVGICLSGYYGGKITPIIATLGVIIGFGLMINFISKGYKLSGLVGGVSFFNITIGSIIVGVIGDIIYYFIRKNRK